MTHSFSQDLRVVVISIFYVDYDSAGAGELYFLSMVFCLDYDCVFFCFLIGHKVKQIYEDKPLCHNVDR